MAFLSLLPVNVEEPSWVIISFYYDLYKPSYCRVVLEVVDRTRYLFRLHLFLIEISCQVIYLFSVIEINESKQNNVEHSTLKVTER